MIRFSRYFFTIESHDAYYYIKKLKAERMNFFRKLNYKFFINNKFLRKLEIIEKLSNII